MATGKRGIRKPLGEVPGYRFIFARAQFEPIMVYSAPDNAHRMQNHYTIRYLNGRDSDDFTWGYYGTGPHATAYSILMEMFGERIAEERMDDFVDLYVSKLDPKKGFRTDSFEVSGLLSIGWRAPK
ncbi:MAG: hypothetical protein LVQ95_00280 [Candidatus Micrarchaeales archaeon]|nr:hypothetical protein [Candidatus Micrarchaeales archaeon]